MAAGFPSSEFDLRDETARPSATGSILALDQISVPGQVKGTRAVLGQAIASQETDQPNHDSEAAESYPNWE